MIILTERGHETRSKELCVNMPMGKRIYRDDDGGSLAIEWDLFESGRSIHPPSLSNPAVSSPLFCPAPHYLLHSLLSSRFSLVPWITEVTKCSLYSVLTLIIRSVPSNESNNYILYFFEMVAETMSSSCCAVVAASANRPSGHFPKISLSQSSFVTIPADQSGGERGTGESGNL